jgi:DNA (cytosine-5)-methyltransferase 1
MKPAYYNEFDLYAAQWLRNLIAAGHIAPGDVDTRSIEDVRPDDLRGYTQCHFFAGVGVWSLALRRAGWPDDRPVWTGSCPCQPFSAAGKGAGFADERHLWPAFYHLIKERRPTGILGEQVASSAVDAWIDLVHADLEALDYSFGSVPFPSAGVGAPHIRDRNYWVADAIKGQRGRRANNGPLLGHREAVGRNQVSSDLERGGQSRGLGHTDSAGSQPGQPAAAPNGHGRSTVANGDVRRLADANIIAGGQGGAIDGRRDKGGDAQPRSRLGGDGLSHAERPGPTDGFWRDADWLGCTDGRWRPVEPGTSPLAHGSAARVGRLRAYGNAVNAEAARVFIEAVMEAL